MGEEEILIGLYNILYSLLVSYGFGSLMSMTKVLSF